MSIGARVAMGYLVLIAVIVAVMLYQRSLVEETQAINKGVHKTFRAGLSSVQLKNDLAAIDEFWKKFLASTDPRYEMDLRERLTQFRRKIQELQDLHFVGLERAAVDRLAEATENFEQLLIGKLEDPGELDPDRPPEDVTLEFGKLVNQTEVMVQINQESILDGVAKSETTFNTVELASWLGLGTALVLGLTIAFLISRSIAVPIGQLTRATRGLAKGDFSHHVDDAGSDEVAELARHFNAMVRRLGELDQLKSDFVSHVSHEFKAPLASMQETTSLLLEEIPGSVNAKQSRLLELNLQCGRRLSAMIGNLLDLSRLESGVMEYDFQLNDLTALVEEVVAEMEPLARERGTDIVIETTGLRLWARCDGGRVLQVLRNLIDNAMKFSPAGSPVCIRLESRPTLPDSVPASIAHRVAPAAVGYGEIAIFDEGSGVAEEHKERIFDKFHQVKKGRKVSGQGVGLGLAISRTIIESHGGALWVVDNEPQGSVFKLLLALGEKRAKEPSGLV